jgi:hypothetical protein
MCKICGGTRCVAECPNYRERGAQTGIFCVACAAQIGRERVFYGSDRAAVCEACAPFLTVEELCELSGVENSAGLLPLLGFLRRGS